METMANKQTLPEEVRELPKLSMKPIEEIDSMQISTALGKNRPFVVRGWVKASDGWGLDDPKWARHTGQVTLVPGDDTTVSAASYVLRKSGMTREMTFQELFERILGQGEWQPLMDPNERYYMFGGKVPSSLLEALPWPSDLEFIGSSPYVASEGVTAKAHYDHWYAFLVQLHGTKAVKMFPPWDYSFIYPEHEKTTDNPRRALVDLNNPDFNQFPLLKQLHGEIAVLNAGDLLYMPVDWWHEVETAGFSVSINRRLRRSALDWAGALLIFGYSVLQGAYRYGIEPIPSKEIKGLATHAYDEWKSDTGKTQYDQWCGYLAKLGRDQSKSLRIPEDFGVLMAQWLQTEQEPTNAEFNGLSHPTAGLPVRQ
ncbi:hypothetical protein X757_06825 [Mesorhizobium sp. LSHC414A00]|nr:hypothetical protein X757_06825 [Mesorhizobium sp. LSHC414A00]